MEIIFNFATYIVLEVGNAVRAFDILSSTKGIPPRPNVTGIPGSFTRGTYALLSKLKEVHEFL
jgi:hypothetical protein